MTARRDAGRVRVQQTVSVLVVLWTAASAGADTRTPFTQMEAGPFGRATHVVLAHVERVVDIAPRADARRGPQLVHASVVQVFKGRAVTERTRDITVRVSGPRPTLNPERPSAPYLAAGAKGRYVFFLQRRSGGHAFDLNTLFEAESNTGQQKVLALTKIASLRREPNDAVRAKATLDWLVASQRSRSRWARINAARELNYLVEKCPELFDARARTQLRNVPTARMPRDQRVWLQRLFTRLGDRSAAEATRPGPAAKPQSAWRTAYTKAANEDARYKLLDKALKTAGNNRAVDAYADVLWAWDTARRDAVRVALADRLAAGDHRRIRTPLRARYALIETLAVREALIRMIGLLGNDEDVPWLTTRLDNRALARTVLLALARIRTSAAMERLRAEHKRCAIGDDEDRERARWLAHLLSDEFVAGERARGHRIGPR